MVVVVIVRIELDAVQGKPNIAQLSFMKFIFLWTVLFSWSW